MEPRNESEDDEAYYLSLIPKPKPDRLKPRTIKGPMLELLARYGLSESTATQQRDQLWEKVVGTHLARDSRLGHLRKGTLLVVARNHVVQQELHMRRRTILHALREGGLSDVERLSIQVENF